MLRLMVIMAALSPVAAFAELPAFPGAVGQGAAAVGGRSGDVYHVTNLDDYSRKAKEKPVPGSLRYGIETAEAPRTIVFDVAGAIELHAPLGIEAKKMTIAGQTSSGGVTLWGYPVNIDESSDLVVRYLRVRTGDFNARGVKATEKTAAVAGKGRADLDASTANAVDVGGGSERVIIDHVSAAWGMDETFSVTRSRDITVQHCIIAESLDHSFHAKGAHGYGSLIRGEVTPEDQAAGVGGYTLYGNLWAHHQARNPSFGGQQSLRRGESEEDRRRTDANLVNSVIYDWGQRPTHRNLLGKVRLALVGNYYVNGPAKAGAYIFYEGVDVASEVFHDGNFIDADQDGTHNGQLVSGGATASKQLRGFGPEDSLHDKDQGGPPNFFELVSAHVRPAEEAYAAAIRLAGASLWRDAIDVRIIESVVTRTGGIINSQELFRASDGKLAGIDDVPKVERPAGFDTDGDGMPDEFEAKHGLDPKNPDDRNGTGLSSAGHTNLEVYLNGLVIDVSK